MNPYHYERVISPAIDLSNLSLNTNSVQSAASALTNQQSNLNYQYNHQLNNSTIPSVMNLIGQPKDEPKTFTNLETQPVYNQTQLQTNSHNNQFDMWSTTANTVQQQQLNNQLINTPVCSALTYNPSMVLQQNSQLDTLNSRLPSTNSPTINSNDVNFWSTNHRLLTAAHENSSPNCNPNLANTATNLLSPSSHITLDPSPRISTLPMPEYWCSIAYFELDQQIGETFKGMFLY